MTFSFQRFEGSDDDIHFTLAFKMHPAIDNL